MMSVTSNRYVHHELADKLCTFFACFQSEDCPIPPVVQQSGLVYSRVDYHLETCLSSSSQTCSMGLRSGERAHHGRTSMSSCSRKSKNPFANSCELLMSSFSMSVHISLDSMKQTIWYLRPLKQHIRAILYSNLVHFHAHNFIWWSLEIVLSCFFWLLVHFHAHNFIWWSLEML